MKSRDITAIPHRKITHPLDPLSAAELRATIDGLRTAKGLTERHGFVIIRLDEPPKETVRRFRPGEPIEREAFAVVYDADSGETHEAVIVPATGEVRSWALVPDVQPQVMLDEFGAAIDVVRASPAFQAGLARRGIDDPALVHIEAWSIGDMAPEGLEDRRLAWTPCWVKSDPQDNHYAHPIRGLHAIVDLQAMEVVHVEDHGLTPLPTQPGNYREEDVGGYRDGPEAARRSSSPRARASRSTAGRSAGRSGASASASTSARASTCTRSATRTAGACARSRTAISIAELVIPYGDPGPGGYRKNAFDIGEYGLGLLTNSLELGCDCLGEIRYLDVDLADAPGRGDDDPQRDLHARGGRRPPLEALRLDDGDERGAPLAGGSSSPRS